MTAELALGRVHKHRIEALNDGIYAVAMTLLVLELRLPEAVLHASDAEFAQALANLAPKFIAWLLSFFILALFWIGHQRAFHFVRHVDAKLTWINVLALAGVALAWRYPRFGTMPFVLMFLLARIGRRVEARATAQDALLTDRPIP